MAAASALAKQANGLVTYYSNAWMEKYGRPPEINRYRDKWGFHDMIEDLGYEGSKKVIDYYMTTGRIGHPLKHLLSNYDRLNRVINDIEKDAVDRERIRKETQQRVEEWKKTHAD